MKNKLKISVPALIVLLILLFSSTCFVTTQKNEYTIVRQFGAVVKIVDEPGLTVKTYSSTSSSCSNAYHRRHITSVRKCPQCIGKYPQYTALLSDSSYFPTG